MCRRRRCRGPLARAQCDSQGHGRRSISSTGHGAEGFFFLQRVIRVCRVPPSGSVLTCLGFVVFLFMYVWRGPAGDHRSTGMKHPGYMFRPSDGSLPPSWQSADFRPRQQSGENFVVFRVAPVSSVRQGPLEGQRCQQASSLNFVPACFLLSLGDARTHGNREYPFTNSARPGESAPPRHTSRCQQYGV